MEGGGAQEHATPTAPAAPDVASPQQSPPAPVVPELMRVGDVVVNLDAQLMRRDVPGMMNLPWASGGGSRKNPRGRPRKQKKTVEAESPSALRVVAIPSFAEVPVVHGDDAPFARPKGLIHFVRDKYDAGESE